MALTFGVLGPVMAGDAGEPVPLRGPRHREVLARLIAARGRMVPVATIVDDLWVAPPDGAVSAVRTFVAALRRALEPARRPRQPARVLVTEGSGYALHTAPDTVDAWRFEAAVTGRPPLESLDEALSWWRGPAYADVTDAGWARAERSRLAELRLHAVELRADALLAAGRGAEVIGDLDAHVTAHPWREDAWRLFALALYRAGRQGDALAVLRRARTRLVEQLGIDPGPALRTLEADMLRQEGRLTGIFAEVAADHDRIAGAGARLGSAVGLLRTLAVAGGLDAARRHRAAAVAAAEERGDPELTARVIGAYDVPAIWTRVDDPAHASAIVAAATRALDASPPSRLPARARLLATVAVESRGALSSAFSTASAAEAERIARRLGDPALLVFALNGVFMQSFHRTGLAPRRDAIGVEIVEVAGRHGLHTAEVLGHLIRMQARSGLGDFTAASGHAAAADELAATHDLPLVTVFTTWYRAMRAGTEAAYREAAALLDGAGMPGLSEGLLPLALLSVGVRESGFGPYEPWVRPLLDGTPAADAPDPPPDLLAEALWTLLGRAAEAQGDTATRERVRRALAPAAGQQAGAGSGVLNFGALPAGDPSLGVL